MRIRYSVAAFVLGCALLVSCSGVLPPQTEKFPQVASWTRHTIDSSSKGADGVRLLDVNADSQLDIATGWEQGGRIRAYLHPGFGAVVKEWPAVTVGDVGDPEDAVFVDLDGDGAVDIVSSCEGKTKSLFVHWAPVGADRYLDSGAWETAAIPGSEGKQQWMFVLPFDVDGKNGIDLIAGSKNDGAQIGWWESPENPRDLASWTWHPLYDAGWIMSLVASDMDGDGDADVVASDRKGPLRGVLWLENPGTAKAHDTWAVHRVGPVDQHEVMFLALADLDQDGLEDILVPDRSDLLLYYRRTDATGQSWEAHEIRLPGGIGTGKSVAVGDIDLDGRSDIVFSCERARDEKHGVMWMSNEASPLEPGWSGHPISGPTGVKYDLVELIDLDGDGDLDVLTCEEVENLGVFWYENPLRTPGDFAEGR